MQEETGISRKSLPTSIEPSRVAAERCALGLTAHIMAQHAFGFREAAAVAAEAVPHLQTVVSDPAGADLHFIIFHDHDTLKTETHKGEAAVSARSSALETQGHPKLVINLSWVVRSITGQSKEEIKHENHRHHFH